MRPQLVAANTVQVATQFEITSIPTLLLFKEGSLIKRVVGLKDLNALRQMVTEVMNS